LNHGHIAKDVLYLSYMTW